MSPIRRPLPELSAIDVPFLDVILAFLQQVLHIRAPEHLVVLSFEWTTDIPASPLMRMVVQADYTVRIVLDTPLPSIGNKLQFSLEHQSDSYVITGIFIAFEPGWRRTA